MPERRITSPGKFETCLLNPRVEKRLIHCVGERAIGSIPPVLPRPGACDQNVTELLVDKVRVFHDTTAIIDVEHYVLVKHRSCPQELPGFTIKHKLDTHLSSSPQHLSLFTCDGGIVPLELIRRLKSSIYQDSLMDVVHIQIVPSQMLIIPDDFARFRVQRERRVGIQQIALIFSTEAARYRSVRAGDPGAPVYQVELWIVGARHPDRYVLPLLERNTPPSIATGLAGPGGGMSAPQFFACFGIVSGNEAAFWVTADTTGSPCENLAANYDRAG